METPDIRFGIGNSRNLHPRRPPRDVLGSHTGSGGKCTLPVRTNDRIVRRQHRRRRAGTDSCHPGTIYIMESRRQKLPLSGCERFRGRVAQAPYLVGDTRHLALRTGHRTSHTADTPPRRKPKSGLGKRRKRNILPERTRRRLFHKRLPRLNLRSGQG